MGEEEWSPATREQALGILPSGAARFFVAYRSAFPESWTRLEFSTAPSLEPDIQNVRAIDPQGSSQLVILIDLDYDDVILCPMAERFLTGEHSHFPIDGDHDRAIQSVRGYEER